MYYIFIEDNKINGAGQCRQLNEGIINFEVTKDLFNAFVENPDMYIWNGEDVVVDPDYEEKQKQIEQERINSLTMTALDFIGVLQSLGLTLIEINAYLEANLELKMQLTYCQNVYCGVVRQLMPLSVGDLTITDEIIVNAFRAKNREEIEKLPMENVEDDEKVVENNVDTEDIKPLEDQEDD